MTFSIHHLEQFAQRLINRPHADDSQAEQPFESGGIRDGHDEFFEAERLRFLSSHLRLQRAAHFARQAHFAEDRRVRVERRVSKTRRDTRRIRTVLVRMSRGY